MAERMNIPGSAACGQWEMLLADALDHLLAPQDEAIFTEHKANCQACAALFEEARRGREWLEFLAPEPEVPAGLVDRILAKTGPGQRQAHPVMAGAGAMALPGRIPAWQRPGLMGSLRRWAEPRLMMTAAMAFFSIALTLNLSGVRLGQIRLSDLRPTAVRSFMERQFTMASVPIIRYYDHLQLVNEVQSRVRELRGEYDEIPQQNQNQSQPPSPGESKKRGGGPDVDRPDRRGAPAQANADNFGRFLETALVVRNKGQVEFGIVGTSLAGEQIFRLANTPANTAGITEATLQNRAVRRLLKPEGNTASERSRVWTA